MYFMVTNVTQLKKQNKTVLCRNPLVQRYNTSLVFCYVFEKTLTSKYALTNRERGKIFNTAGTQRWCHNPKMC